MIGSRRLRRATRESDADILARAAAWSGDMDWRRLDAARLRAIRNHISRSDVFLNSSSR